jgi:hypothetical protein
VLSDRRTKDVYHPAFPVVGNVKVKAFSKIAGRATEKLRRAIYIYVGAFKNQLFFGYACKSKDVPNGGMSITIACSRDEANKAFTFD